MMWQEARKQERHIKTLMVDYRRRAERRRDFYERIKQDPIKFLRVYGRPAKLHLDSEVAKAAENPNNMMPWTGDPSILIDRFDARTNLEHYDSQLPDDLKLTSVERIEERLCMYERYRCLIHNDYAGVTEAMALKQIDVDEKYGDLEKKRKEEEEASKKSQEPKAAIGFTYEDSHPPSTGSTVSSAAHNQTAPVPEDSESEGEADSDMDIDVELDLATLSLEGRRQLAKSASSFGLHASDFVRLLDADQQLETELRLAKALEEEKLQLAGRKSRRARRLLRERRGPERIPKTLSIKAGLLSGQPISRRTIYLSASSSDSGEYASDEEDDDVDAGRSPNSKAVALREQRAKAKPILTTAKGPSILIGGMTSIALCRRRRRGDGGLDKSNKQASGRGSSSSSTASDTGRGPRSSNVSGPYRASRHGARDSSRRHKKRPRVEYITTFGDDEDEEEKLADRFPRGSNLASSLWSSEKAPGAAASAVAASVVSKLLGSERKPYSPPGIRTSSSSKEPSRGPPLHSDFRQERQRRRDSFVRSSQHNGYRRHASSSGSSRSSSRSRTRSVSSQRSAGGRGSYRSMRPYRRQSPATRRGRTGSSRDSGSRRRRSPAYRRRSGRSSGSSPSPPRNSISRSVCDRRLRSKSTGSGSRASSTGSTAAAAVPTVETKEPTPPVRRRYYRPELESDDNSQLSEDPEEDENENGKDTRCPVVAAGATPSNRSSNQATPQQQQQSRCTLESPHNTAGKMMMTPQSVSGEHNSNTITKTVTPGSTAAVPRLTPQELLKRRVQAQLTKAFNADKKAELEKQVQLEQERQAREEGLRRQALRFKHQEEKRQREERRAAMRAAGGAVDESDSSSSSSSESSRTAAKPRRSTGHRRRSPASPVAARNRGAPSRVSTPSSPPRGHRSRSPVNRSPFRSGRLPSPPPPMSNSGRVGSSHSQSREFSPKMHPIGCGNGDFGWRDHSSHAPAYYESRGPRGRTAPRPDRYHGSDRYHPADSSYAHRDPHWQIHSPRGSGRPWAPAGFDDRRGPGHRGSYRTAENHRYYPSERPDSVSRFDSDRGPRSYGGRR